MKPGEVLAIWLHDEAAKVFLGIQGPHPVSRWVVVGQLLEETSIGVWVDVQRLEERRPATDDAPAERVMWGVKPGQCVVRYEYIITAQRLKSAPEDPEMGFRPR